MIGVKVDGLMMLVIAGVGTAAYVSYKKKDIIAAVNPANDNNIINNQVSSVVKKITQGKSSSLGELTYKTRAYNPLAWIFEGVGKITGDLP